MTNILKQKEWDYDTSNVNIVSSRFINYMVEALNMVAPLKQIKVKEKKNLWINNECKGAIQNKMRLIKYFYIQYRNKAGIDINKREMP